MEKKGKSNYNNKKNFKSNKNSKPINNNKSSNNDDEVQVKNKDIGGLKLYMIVK